MKHLKYLFLSALLCALFLTAGSASALVSGTHYANEPADCQCLNSGNLMAVYDAGYSFNGAFFCNSTREYGEITGYAVDQSFHTLELTFADFQTYLCSSAGGYTSCLPHAIATGSFTTLNTQNEITATSYERLPSGTVIENPVKITASIEITNINGWLSSQGAYPTTPPTLLKLRYDCGEGEHIFTTLPYTGLDTYDFNYTGDIIGTQTGNPDCFPYITFDNTATMFEFDVEGFNILTAPTPSGLPAGLWSGGLTYGGALALIASPTAAIAGDMLPIAVIVIGISLGLFLLTYVIGQFQQKKSKEKDEFSNPEK